jgi:hypothetical protein
VSSQLADLEILQPKIIKNKIESHKIIISPTAQPGWCQPKNKTDQKIFRSKLKIKITKNQFRIFVLFFKFQTKNKLMPIKINRIVQTGPKSQLGGANAGRFKLTYQLLIFGAVKIEPTKAAPKQVMIETVNLIKAFIAILSLYQKTGSKTLPAF